MAQVKFKFPAIAADDERPQVVNAGDKDFSRDESSSYWASLSAASVFASLGSSSSGLSEADAHDRLLRYGHNALPPPVRRPWYVQLGANFVHLFAMLLWIGAVLAWIAGMPQLGVAIVLVILINGLFAYWQEYQAERSAEALQALLPRHVTVRRENEERLIPATGVVPGDLLLLAEGVLIPADARVIVTERLRVDMSSLTGESRPVARTARDETKSTKVSTAMRNLVFAGTSVAGGRGEAVVFATGANTEFGRLAQLTHAQVERPSPLQKELESVTRIVTLLAVCLGVVFFVGGTLFGGLSRTSAFLFAVGIIVANVPEGLLPTLTLALALGVRRMAKRNALLKRLSAVETLGATTVILTDKTGTLTENEMTVREAWTSSFDYRLSGTGYDPTGRIEQVGNTDTDLADVKRLLTTAALCCDAHLIRPNGESRNWDVIGDPTEAAILVAAGKANISAENLKQWPRIAELPFDSVRKRMTTIQQMDGQFVACVKGAPSEVFPLCTSMVWKGSVVLFDERLQRSAREVHDRMAGCGLRVLAVASRQLGTDQPDEHVSEEVEHKLTLLGLIGMEDPPRAEVPAAISACRRAGIRVVMVTGDDGLTAAAIAREIGLHEVAPRSILGTELDALSDHELEKLLRAGGVLFARVAPEHKLRLVRILQTGGEVVAVTGDGVNDAPALKRADIGVAMGATGTDVACEAADMILTDDNFASIAAAIEEGRAVYDNVRKFVTYIFASNIPELVPFIVFVLFRIPLPLTVMQILAVDLGTDLMPALALGAEHSEPDVLQRPPRKRSERLLNLPTLLRAYVWLGMIEAVLSLGGFFFVFWLSGWQFGTPLPDSGRLYLAATTMTFAGIVACQIGNVFACRSGSRSVWRLGFATNRMLLAGIAVEVTLLLVLIYVPALRGAFGLAALAPQHYLLLLTFGPLLIILEEGRKWMVRARYSKIERMAS
ncbi:MAG TPA: cation-transporting P-type ATPase [Pyrinomonadaceae bacterium]|nr:cation-transporting P-type ATPase [Pyrinomonadaceae bacterium]